MRKWLASVMLDAAQKIDPDCADPQQPANGDADPIAEFYAHRAVLSCLNGVNRKDVRTEIGPDAYMVAALVRSGRVLCMGVSCFAGEHLDGRPKTDEVRRAFADKLKLTEEAL
jgi:hypothetical protein